MYEYEIRAAELKKKHVSVGITGTNMIYFFLKNMYFLPGAMTKQ